MNTKVLVSKRQIKDMMVVKESVKHSVLSSVNDALIDPDINIHKKNKQKLQLFFEEKSLSANV